MIILSDLHLKEKSYYFEYQKQFLNWILENYNNEIIIQLGDVFDSHAMPWKVYHEFVLFLSKRKNKTYILKGNHDQGYSRGISLLGLETLPNIEIILETKEFEIENCKCLFLPYETNIEKYENMKWRGDFCFAHLMPVEEAFGGKDGVTLQGIDAYKIFGHIHLNSKNKNYNFLIPGGPLPTRNGEVNNPLYRIIDKKIEEVEHPIFFEFEDVIYPNEPKNKCNVINVKSAPSVLHVYEQYKDYNIREEGIELLVDIDNSDNIVSFELDTIKKKFIKFCEIEDIQDNQKNKCLSYL